MENSVEKSLKENLQGSKRLEDLSISTFLRKTYEIVDDEANNEIVSWNDTGDAIVIKNPTEFAEKLLPIYFKHSKLASFVRQLNMYDFRKWKTEQYENVFVHDYFRRGRKDLLLKIKRKSVSNNHKSVVKEVSPEEALSDENALLKQENGSLKKTQCELEQKVNRLESQILELTMQNKIYSSELQKKAATEEQLRLTLNSLMNSGLSTLGSQSILADGRNALLSLGAGSIGSQPNLILLSGENMTQVSTVPKFEFFSSQANDSLMKMNLNAATRSNFSIGLEKLPTDQTLNRLSLNGLSMSPFTSLAQPSNYDPIILQEIIQKQNPQQSLDILNISRLGILSRDLLSDSK